MPVSISVTLDGNGNPVTSASPLATSRPDVRQTAQTLSLTALNNAFAIAVVNGVSTVAFEVTGLSASGGAIITAQSSTDGGINWNSKTINVPQSIGALANTLSADGGCRVDIAGHTNFRFIVTTIGTGTATISYSASVAAGVVSLGAPLPPGTNTIGAVTFASGASVTLAAGSAAIGSVTFPSAQPVTDTQTALAATALGTPADAVWGGSGSSSIVSALKAIWTAITTATLKTSVTNGSVGADFSSTTNHTALPSAIGATIGTSTYGGSGPFTGYILVASAAANATRANIDIENISGSQVVVVRDDGTAATGSAPVNASWFLLAGGGTGPSQGGAWSSTTFRGRIQLWMATVPTYPPTVFGD
jgi:hypothetical protein